MCTHRLHFSLLVCSPVAVCQDCLCVTHGVIIIWLCTASLCASGAALLSLENKHFIPELGFTRDKMKMAAPLPPASPENMTFTETFTHMVCHWHTQANECTQTHTHTWGEGGGGGGERERQTDRQTDRDRQRERCLTRAPRHVVDLSACTLCASTVTPELENTF